LCGFLAEYPPVGVVLQGNGSLCFFLIEGSFVCDTPNVGFGLVAGGFYDDVFPF
jgi:hypothetical protein